MRAELYCQEVAYFYPRSPCGERHSQYLPKTARAIISIHALLAESDNVVAAELDIIHISIHALLAESDHR